MKKTFVWSICVMVTGAVAAALPSCARGGEGEISGEKHALGTVAEVRGPADERFEDPQSIVKQFGRELARLADEKTAVPAADLVREAAEERTCTVETLPDPGVKLSPEAIYRRARQSVVIVGGISKHKRAGRLPVYCAAGFVAHQDGVIVTNFHLVVAFGQMKTVGVMTDGGQVFPVKKVLAANKRDDVAVLKIEAHDLKPLPMTSRAPVGTTVYCLSHPVLNSQKTENGFYAFTQGIVSGKYRIRAGGDEPVNVLAVTTDYAEGSSGGPILNEHGAVVGMVCQTLPIFHGDYEGEIQMIWKYSRPSSSILSLLK